MFEAIVAAALRHRMAVLIATLITALWGVWAYSGLTIESFPDPTDTQVNLITINAGQPAEEMERQVSVPIERAVNGMPGLFRTRSINLFGLSFVTLTFRDGIDPIFARAQTLERLSNVDLPDGVKPELGSFSTPIGEIYRYTLRGERNDPLELRTLQDWVVIPRLLRVEGVADVVSYGGLVRQIEVRPDRVAMAARGLTMGDLESALREASRNASGGIVERGSEQLIIRSEGIFRDVPDIGNVSVATRDGTPILLKDIASVQNGWMPRQGIVGRAEDQDAVEGIVLMRLGENPSEVLERVRGKITEINTQVLPKGTEIWTFYDRTELVSSTLKTVGRNLAEGALLVTFVLFVFLLDLRAALIVASIIPLSLFTAFIYLRSRGMAANLISMGSVDFGIIVDGAVVIIEAITFRMAQAARASHAEHAEQGIALPHPDTVTERVKRAVSDVARPTVFSLLIIIAAYLPIFLLQRVEGRMFSPMAHTVVAALLGSLAFSITLVPVLATFAYRKPRPHRDSPVLIWATRAYLPVLRAALRRPAVVLAAATLSLGGAGFILANRGSEFLPELNEGALYITFTLPSNTALDEGRRLVPTLATLVDGFPQVETRVSQLGRPEDGTDPKMANNLEFFVKLKPAAEWPADTPTLGALVDKMAATFGAIPGLEVNFSQPIRDNVNENISGQVGQIALKIYGDDLQQLQATAEAAKAAIADVRGVADLGIVKSGEVPQIQVHPDRHALGRFGLTMEELQSFLSTALGGQVVGTLWEQDRSFDVVLRLPRASRDTLESVAGLRVPTPGGGLVPLSSLAEVEVGYGRASINRENGQRYLGVRMNVRGRDLGSFVEEARAVVVDKVPLPAGMSVEWGGEFESKERAMNRLLVVVPLALVITLGLLFNAFGSMQLALLVLLNVPFALIGGALGLWLFEMPMSIAAAVGFIALVGQASLNGVLVLSAIDELRQKGLPLGEAIVQGARDRLRAVLMTAALAALGLVPAAFSKAMGAETQRPIAVVIVGGTVSAAILTLVVLPVMYQLMIQARARLTRAELPSPAPATAPPA
ncbi:efflux RND transporter permease subunit [Chondromyces apiculatus]|uniref:Cobalt-zinc-cadmium resistance protein CzcA / Cation efflux system protein CusA n=1 Tax=Chondromyces apiculatus DSM 436 TaxID=1192034 RepID=A0A017THM1_9BACT|nr:CusA/CzcA family heavy metal efflux RND transporter [Chondromyces apiculatus]EYF08340.1 Cobalt-zinc-cadmium resistance protein CzcA / Cation efflux system protein CusA [Chondromyces apiculatus DSM 436]